jgi:hypothetical protein
LANEPRIAVSALVSIINTELSRAINTRILGHAVLALGNAGAVALDQVALIQGLAGIDSYLDAEIDAAVAAIEKAAQAAKAPPAPAQTTKASGQNQQQSTPPTPQTTTTLTTATTTTTVQPATTPAPANSQ